MGIVYQNVICSLICAPTPLHTLIADVLKKCKTVNARLGSKFEIGTQEVQVCEQV